MFLILSCSFAFLVFSFDFASAFSFVVFGDNRDGDQIYLDLIGKVNAEDGVAFCVNTGDFVSHGRKSEYEKYLRLSQKLKPKVYHVPGNHDLVKGGYRYYQRYFGPYYYSFDYENAHFVILNNAFRESFHAEQFKWLKGDLARTKQEHIFVFMHKPTFDPTEIYSDHIMSGRQTIQELMQVFERHQVDYVFTGHLHGFARDKRNGVVYVVTAGAGAPLYLPAGFGGFYHFVKVTVDGDDIIDRVIKIYD